MPSLSKTSSAFAFITFILFDSILFEIKVILSFWSAMDNVCIHYGYIWPLYTSQFNVARGLFY